MKSPDVKHPISNGKVGINWKCLNNDVPPSHQNVDATDEAAIQAALVARAQAAKAHLLADPTGEIRLFGNYDENLENDPPAQGSSSHGQGKT